ncbi:MAG: 1,2-phenylacetyl-CoA epoxidase subunit PaaD [Betaproteobacteria bacterium]
MVTMVTPLSVLPEPLFAPTAAACSARGSDAWALLATVPDPEIPVISVCELGIVRAVRVDGARVEVDVTPTYAGCPATEVIAADIRAALAGGGFDEVIVNTVLSPPWTTDAITRAGRAKLHAYGIAPPGPAAGPTVNTIRFAPRVASCPRCHSRNTERIAEFGSTPCKSLFRCRACGEPFDYFKPL